MRSMLLQSDNVSFRPRARQDIIGIWEYTYVTWSITQADKYVDMLSITCQLIASNPSLFGRDESRLGIGIRSYRAGKHRIFYRLRMDGGILVLRVLHSSMRITKMYFTSDD